MERYEIGDDARLAAMVAAAGRGEEAVFTKDGEVVGSFSPRSSSRDGNLSDRAARAQQGLLRLRAVHTALPPGWHGTDAARLIRDMRDMDDH